MATLSINLEFRTSSHQHFFRIFSSIITAIKFLATEIYQNKKAPPQIAEMLSFKINYFSTMCPNDSALFHDQELRLQVAIQDHAFHQ